MKTLILAAAAVVALGVGSAFADGQGGVTNGYQQWQAENGNPMVPATEWFARQRAARLAQQPPQVQQQQVGSQPQTGNGHS